MVRSPLRLLQRRNSEQPDNLSPSPDKAQHTRVQAAAHSHHTAMTTVCAHGGSQWCSPCGLPAAHSPLMFLAARQLICGGDDAQVESAAQDDAAPATAGDYVPERAQPSEQIVLLLHDPKAGLLTRIWRCGMRNVAMNMSVLTTVCAEVTAEASSRAWLQCRTWMFSHEDS